jgi:hypothetical protein
MVPRWVRAPDRFGLLDVIRVNRADLQGASMRLPRRRRGPMTPPDERLDAWLERKLREPDTLDLLSTELEAHRHAVVDALRDLAMALHEIRDTIRQDPRDR